MSIIVRYHPASLTAETYDAVSAKIQESPEWPPDGLVAHYCFGSDGSLMVSEMWDSEEQFRAFGEKLMPVLAEGGIEMASDPEIFPIHNVENPAA